MADGIVSSDEAAKIFQGINAADKYLVVDLSQSEGARDISAFMAPVMSVINDRIKAGLDSLKIV